DFIVLLLSLFFFSSRRRHTRSKRDWSSDVCSSDLQSVDDEYPAFRANILNVIRKLTISCHQDFFFWGDGQQARFFFNHVNILVFIHYLKSSNFCIVLCCSFFYVYIVPGIESIL